MKAARMTGMGWLGASLVLFVACSGKVQSLGENQGVGGKAKGGNGTGGLNTGGWPDEMTTGGKYSPQGGTNFGIGGNEFGSTPVRPLGGNTYFETRGAQATGGATMDPTGGASSATGGYAATGGASIASGGYATGGATYGSGGYAAGGDDWGTGGALAATGGALAATGGAANTNYPGYPLLGGPIDKTCTCTGAGLVCDSERQCVPSCSAEERCTKWLTNRAVKSMVRDGTALFYATARQTDVLGNPLSPTDGSLFKVPTPTSMSPTLVATGLPDPLKILGRYAGSTFLTTNTGTSYALYEVTDVGAVTKLADVGSGHGHLQGKWLVYTDTATPSNLMGFDLAAGRTPFVVAAGGSRGIVVGDRAAFFRGTAASEHCVISLSTPATPASAAACENAALHFSSIESFASDTTQLFVGPAPGSEVWSSDPAGNRQLTLYKKSGTDAVDGVKAVDGWLYSPVVSLGSGNVVEVVRYPSTVGRLPQEILPMYWGSRTFAVSKTDIYWAYPLEKANDTQYIFYAPLPAQPCDAGLPCADATQVCTSGFCKTMVSPATN